VCISDSHLFKIVTLYRVAAFLLRLCSPLFEIARLLAASRSRCQLYRKRESRHRATAVKRCVTDCVADCVRFAIPQATERQRIGDQINAAMIFAWSHFVKLHLWDYLIPTTNALRFVQTSLSVHANMIQQNGALLPQPVLSRRKGNYTGERLKALRPETYHRVVRLLAEPREHVSIREICRQCHVTDDTVKAIERREAIPIAARKQQLMFQAARIAKLAYDRVEDQIDSAPLPQAVVTAGVFTDKLQLLSEQPTLRIETTHKIDFVAELQKLKEEARAKVEEMKRVQLALPSGDAIADPGAETSKPASADASRREENAPQKADREAE
jgi:hypothetical protein